MRWFTSKSGLKLWLSILVAVILAGLSGWLWWQNTQLNQQVQDQTSQISSLNSQVALLQASPTPTPTPSATPTPTPSANGTISGTIAYPASTAPAQTVCAVKTTDATAKTCVNQAGSGGGSLVYSLSIAPGTYYVYASLQTAQGSFTTDYKAYYNKYVTCGATASCPSSDHTQYVPVTVKTGVTTKDVNPTDWYAQ